MVDLVHQLLEDSKTAHPDSLRIMCGWGADEIKRLRADNERLRADNGRLRDLLNKASIPANG